MSSQYGTLGPLMAEISLPLWGTSANLGFASCLVTAAMLLTGGKPNFARSLAISWLVHYIYIFGGSCPLTQFCQVQNSLYIHVLRCPILAALGWRSGVMGKAFGLAISRSHVQILLEAMLRNNLRQVVYTYVPLSPSSITWYRPKGGDALWLGR